MKISFDFDGVLDTNEGQEFIRGLVAANRLAHTQGNPFQIWIVTTRHDDLNNEEVLKIAWEFDIPLDRVIFTNGRWKWKTMDELDIEIHIDDNPDECHLINEKCEKTHSMLFGLNIHKLLIEGTEL